MPTETVQVRIEGRDSATGRSQPMIAMSTTGHVRFAFSKMRQNMSPLSICGPLSASKADSKILVVNS
jgi:hypothetical protein